ncbi:MAG: hypothetical protein ACI9UA_002778 [Pseudoalteromonas tetraodonis]|jgi:hypothetical protein
MPDQRTLAFTPSQGGADWLRRADALARRVNFGWWFDQLALALPIAAVLSMAGVLYLRTLDLAAVWVWAMAIAPVLVAAGFSFWRARTRFIGRRQALVRLDSSLGLDSALSSASQGVGNWPAMEPAARLVLRWRWERSFLPPLVSLVLVAVAALWPLPTALLASHSPAPNPRNVEALEKILEQLKEEPLVEQEDVATLDRELGKLGKDTESLYNPSTLEAADHLAKRTSEALSNLAKASASASRALQGALDPNKSAKDRAAQAEQMEEAIKKMANGALKADPQLREALKDAAANAMQELDPEAAQQLQDMLEQNQQQFEEMLNELAPDLMPGMGDGQEPGDPGENQQPGDGGAEHGEAPPSPLRFHGADRGVEGAKLEPLAPNDGTASSPGELLELRAVKPPDPDGPTSVESAGEPSTEAGGGARLWQENLDPDEQRFLGEFYR